MDTQNGQSAAPLAASHKRPLDEDLPIICTPKKINTPSEAGTPLTVLSSIATPSPLKNTPTQPSAPPDSSALTPTDTPSAKASADTHQPAKRRRFTEKEKEEKRLEKEAQDKAKAERKAQKDEEKRLKEEEKRKKNDEREEKKRAKELEQQQKEEEKRKKERNQLKLNSFFAKPKPGGSSSGTTVVVDATLNSTPTPASLAPAVSLPDVNPGPVSPQKAIQQRAKNEYERLFLPFELPSHAILAPHNRYMQDPMTMALARSRVDELLSQENVMMNPVDINSFKSRFPAYQARGEQTFRVSEVIDRLNNPSDEPIDLTKNDDTSHNPLALLKRIPMKYLHFPEDVRPPYYGTYTKPHTPRQEAKLARNPFSRALPATNYDYDSEAEWEEPEEGEDLDSDGEEDLDEDGDEDLEGFLDDEEDAQVKRRLINGDMEPVSTGLCWEDAEGVSRLNDGSGAISTEFKDFKIGFLLEPQPCAIDPFSTAYWAPMPAPVALSSSTQAALHGAMQPPRLPLTRPMNSMMNTMKAAPATTVVGASKPGKPPKRMIPADQLPEFMRQVEGSDLTKIALIEALKKKFPKLPKDAISNTLSAVAARVGPKEVEKRWVLR